MGIAPAAVPTYLALTSAPKAEALTNRQAVRLIELYGNLESIYENLPNLPSGQVRRKLQESESQVRGYFAANSVDRHRPLPPCEVQNWSLSDMNTERNRQCLRARGFHSLVPLLANPAHVMLDLNERRPRPTHITQ
jgi:hypothetical protein